MINDLNFLSDQCELFKSIQNYTIEIGVFHNEKVTFHYLDLDGNNESKDIPISDLVYYSENGTILFPGKHILQHVLFWLDYRLTAILNEIIDGLFNKHWQENDIFIRFQSFEFEINQYIQSYLSSFSESIQFMANTFDIPTNTTYIMDLEFLKKYICCRIVKK